MRVWRHFLLHNGFLLAAGISYQALFAFFAAIYVAFAITGLWLGGSDDAVNAIIDLINSYIPGLDRRRTASSPPSRCSRSPRARAACSASPASSRSAR